MGNEQWAAANNIAWNDPTMPQSSRNAYREAIARAETRLAKMTQPEREKHYATVLREELRARSGEHQLPRDSDR